MERGRESDLNSSRYCQKLSRNSGGKGQGAKVLRVSRLEEQERKKEKVELSSSIYVWN